MVTSVEVKAKGALRVAEMLQGLERGTRAPFKTRDPEGNMVAHLIRDDLRDITRDHFRSEGARGQSGKWAPLSPKYRAWKARAYPGRRKLTRSGRHDFAGALTGRIPSEHLFDAKPKTLRIGIRQTTETGRIAGYHQGGTRRMPARPILDLTARDHKRFADTIEAVLRRLERFLGRRRAA